MKSSTDRPPSRRLDVLITLLGLLGLLLFLVFYDQAFPSAAIDLDLSRAEITQRARDYLEAQGHDLQDYKLALSLQEDWDASVYLQHTLGVPGTNQLIQSEELPIWYWRARWFRPLQKEEFSVYLATDGEVVAFVHSILEDAPGAALAQDRARGLAESYLVDDRGWVLDDWEPVSASSEEQPGGRIDHHFEWKRRDFAVGEGDLRLAVRVRGDQVGSYNYWLRVPETFLRHFSEQRNVAGFFNNLAFYAGAIFFGLAALLAYLVAVWRGRYPWHTGLVPALAVAAVSLLAGLNYLPLYKSGYSTTQSYSLFWLENLLGLLYSAAYYGAIVFVLWGGGLYLSKSVWSRRNKILPRSNRVPPDRDDRWGILARSGWRGVMLGGLMGGYAVLFYLVATRLFGGWTPMGVRCTSLYATPFPFLGPLRSGFLPAMEEELLFRLVAIPLMLLLTRRRWLALLVPGIVWAFAHLAYVRDPFYLRGIELTLVAIILGLFFLRFDLTTTIVAHYVFNAGLGALPLLRSGEPYFVLSGLIVVATMLAPVVPGLVRGLRRRLSGQVGEEAMPQVALATSQDLPGLFALPLDVEDWPALLDEPAAVVACLRAGDQVIGAAVGRAEGSGRARMPTVYVDPAWRRRYWGSTLVDAVCARLQEQGAGSVTVQVATGDPRTSAFWVSQGWAQSAKTLTRSLEPQPGPTWRELLGRVRGAIRPGEGSVSTATRRDTPEQGGTMPRPRVRETGLVVGELPTGPLNALTDVAGVRVGHTTLIEGQGVLRPGHGPVRTGVTAILPHSGNLFREKVRAAVHTINGFGKVTGFEQVRELGLIESPIALTNTLNVGRVADALVQHAIDHNPDIGTDTTSVNVVVGETNDGHLNDLQGRHVQARHVRAAIESAAPGPVAEGGVGAGTGTSCFGWKGGIGTASRLLPAEAGGFIVGSLVQSNFGLPQDLVVCGVPVGRYILPPGALEPSPSLGGSVMVVLATDAPLSARQLGRLCVRAAAGLARTGSLYGHSSGDFVIAFSTGWRVAHEPAAVTASQVVLADEAGVMPWLFRAVVESVEEAVLNSMFRAETVVGRDGNTRWALPVEEVVGLVQASVETDA